jgi:hypothetical protein
MNWQIWWDREGSAMRPLENEDTEEFARRITAIAWSNGEFVKREAFNKERQQYADWLDEAAADIEDWGMYASEYLQQKWDLPDQVQDYKNRAASIRARGQA